MSGSQKKDIRLQVFVSAQMDDKITDIADVMGITKNGFVRYCIANGVLGFEQTYKLMNENLEMVLDKLNVREQAEKAGLI